MTFKDVSLILSMGVIFGGIVYGYATLNAKVDEIDRVTSGISKDLDKVELAVRNMELRQAASGSAKASK